MNCVCFNRIQTKRALIIVVTDDCAFFLIQYMINNENHFRSDLSAVWTDSPN